MKVWEWFFGKTTVSFVLNGKGDQHKISRETQKKILELAKKWNYQPNQVARSLSLGRTNTVGLIVPDISDVFYASICRKMEDFLGSYQLTVTIGSSDENPKKEQELIEGMRNRQIDGLILASCQVNSDAVLRMLKEHYPLVLFDRFNDQVNANYVLVENRKASVQIVKELVKKGHTRIGMITINPHASTIQERLEGYKQSLEECKLVFDPQLIHEVDFNNRKEGVKSALKQLFEYAPDVTAILFSNNVLAAEGVWATNLFFKEKVNQLDFACFDDLDLFDYSNPKVISVAQPVELIAKNSVELLMNQFRKKNRSKEKLILNPEIIIR